MYYCFKEMHYWKNYIEYINGTLAEKKAGQKPIESLI